MPDSIEWEEGWSKATSSCQTWMLNSERWMQQCDDNERRDNWFVRDDIVESIEEIMSAAILLYGVIVKEKEFAILGKPRNEG